MSTKKLWWLLPLACLAACSNGANHEQNDRQNAESVTTDSVAMPLNSPERKIIHTADFRCEVANVLTAVDTLERAVTSAGGVVQESRVENNTDMAKEVYYKSDSLKKMHTYTTTAMLTLRVPVAALDSVVHSIPAMVSFIDSRTLKQSDVTADYTANKLQIETGTKVYTAEKATKLAKKAEDLVAVQQYEDENTAQYINRKIEHMRLLDEVNYATLTIALAQPPQVYVQVVSNPDFITAVPFTTQLGEAVREGVTMLEGLFVGLVTIWPFILLGLVTWAGYKYFVKRYRANVAEIRSGGAVS